MIESFEEAVAEIKRVDHLFYVSLKYTRTADMMKHMLDRLISMFGHGFESLLKKAKDEGKISDIPMNPALKVNLVLETFPDDEDLRDYVLFYQKLRKINRAPYTKREEFRRHVTMTVSLDDGEVVEVNIDLLKEYYDKAREFIFYLKAQVHGEEE